MDLISKKALLSDLCEDREEGTFCFTDSQAEAADKIIVYVTKRINAQPTIDAAPVVHGRWIHLDQEESTISGKCSCCGWEAHYYEDDVADMPYCPNCGAKMDLEEQNVKDET